MRPKSTGTVKKDDDDKDDEFARSARTSSQFDMNIARYRFIAADLICEDYEGKIMSII